MLALGQCQSAVSILGALGSQGMGGTRQREGNIRPTRGWEQWQPLPLNPNPPPKLGSLTQASCTWANKGAESRRPIGAWRANTALSWGDPGGSLGSHRIQWSPCQCLWSPGDHWLQDWAARKKKISMTRPAFLVASSSGRPVPNSVRFHWLSSC